MLDRLGQRPICDYICLTYRNGLPAQAGTPALHRYTRLALRYILYGVSPAGPHSDCSKKVLITLADAFQACQQVQARTIDSLFGSLSGRDTGLKDQLLILVDTVKQQALDAVTLRHHPHCLSPHADMGRQMPHIQSSYVVACGELLGLRGMAASIADRMRPKLSSAQIAEFVKDYSSSFSTAEVVHTLVRDVNQGAEAADRFVELQALMRWADAASEKLGFDKQGVFYQDDKPELYALTGPPPVGSAAERLCAPWLHPFLAQDILRLCLQPER